MPRGTSTQERLRAIMARAELSRAKVAELVYVSPHVVKAWLKPDTSKSHTPIPLMAIELLELKLFGQIIAEPLTS